MNRPTLTQQRGLRTYIDTERTARSEFRAQARQPMREVQQVPPAPLPKRPPLLARFRALLVAEFGRFWPLALAGFVLYYATGIAAGIALVRAWLVQP